VGRPPAKPAGRPPAKPVGSSELKRKADAKLDDDTTPNKRPGRRPAELACIPKALKIHNLYVKAPAAGFGRSILCVTYNDGENEDQKTAALIDLVVEHKLNRRKPDVIQGLKSDKFVVNDAVKAHTTGANLKSVKDILCG
jgi:hypothetical protein